MSIVDQPTKDEEKPFDLGPAQEDDHQPDPEEHLMLDSGAGRVWLVKIPRHLMERWASVEQDGLELAKIRVYDKKPPEGTRMFIEVPANASNPGAGSDFYEIDVVNQDVKNQIVVAEREKDPTQPASRARTTIMTGKVKHECNLRPLFTKRYRERVKRATEESMPRKRMRMIGESVAQGAAGQMEINRLTSGVTSAAGFAELTRPKQKQAKGQFERMARMPRNQLLDALFDLFRERSYWPIRLLRDRTQQPEVYLKEVLNQIATLHRSGEHNGMWELKQMFQDGVKNEATEQLYKMEPTDTPVYNEEEEEEEEEEEDEDDDMEAVA